MSKKCHFVAVTLTLALAILLTKPEVAHAEAEAEPKTVSSAESLPVEHRGAKPEPFLDFLSGIFGGGKGTTNPKKNTEKKGQNYQQRPAPSIQRPIAVRPPRPPIAPRPPPRLPIKNQRFPSQPQTQPSNNFQTFVNPNPGFNAASSNNNGGSPSDPWQLASPANMAQIKDLQVQCEKDMMRVRIIFDRPFYGMVFSKGHYSNVNCVHVPSGLGQTQATFDIGMQTCGMSSSVNDNYGSPTPQGSYIENTIIIQYDPLLQEVWDQARRLRCTWYDFYEKAVTFRPYQVDMLDPVTANFLGDNLRCWMQIQVGKGPQASEVSGIVKIGQTMTMVLGVKDDENKFDMMVRNCVAHDGKRAPIQLVDERGCVSRPKIMSPFRKVKNFDATANVLAYAYFQAFKFPDSMNVHFQCVVQVCRGNCPEPQCGQSQQQTLPSNPSPDSYGSPQSPAVDSYGAPIGAPIGPAAIDSYGSPIGNPIGPNIDSYGSPSGAPLSVNPNINPRLPNKASNRVFTQQTAGSNPAPTIVKPEGTKAVPDLPEPERVVLSEPGYGDFNKRSGQLSPGSLGGRPRSLDVEGEDDSQKLPRDAKVLKDSVVNAVDSSSGEDYEVKPNSRKRRSFATDANGNRILRVVKRDATEMAEVETTEKVIQVLAPNDVQFALPFNAEQKEEVVINTNSPPADSLCVDTPAFVGVTITFLMILIVALITIVFLWLRIKSLDSPKTKRVL